MAAIGGLQDLSSEAFFATPLEYGVASEYYLAVFASAIGEGVGSATLAPPLELNRNTIVRKYELELRAAHAPLSEAQKVGQVRVYSAGGDHSAVIDFGVPRTVSRIVTPFGVNIQSVAAWAGAQFGFPFYNDALANQAIFPSEVRSERLLVRFDHALDQATAGQQIVLEIPDLPADLELRINDGLPVFINPGAVQTTPGLTSVVAGRWNQDSKRLVSLAEALTALCGDPLADALQTLSITLTSKVPGALSISADPAPLYSHIHRIRFGAETATSVEFESEGYRAIELPLPAPPAGSTRRLEEIRLTVLGKLADERILPPVGPEPVPLPGATLPLAELLLDPAHAVAARLHAGPLVSLSGLRLPLAAGNSGAEARVVLHAPAADPSGDPAEALPGGASEPLTLAAGASGWVSFSFTKPIVLDADAPPWAVLVVTRGTLSWSLGADGSAGAPLALDTPAAPVAELLRGAPNGPWRTLPALLQAAPPTGLMAARGVLRLAGQGSKEAPVAPLLLGVHGHAGAATEAVPSAKGVPLVLVFDPPLALASANPSLAVLSRVAGTVTLRDIDVVWNDR